MATIDKLEYINNTKNLIKNALNTKFNSQIGDGDTFRSYAQKINDIYENWPKVSEENTNFTLNSTKEGKMKIDLKGNISQATSILPSEYTQVDYIFNDANYFDLGLKLTNNSKIEMKFQPTQSSTTNNKMYFGARAGASSNNISINAKNNIFVDFNNSDYATYRTEYAYTQDEIYIVSASKEARVISNASGTILAQNTTLCTDTITTVENVCVGLTNPRPADNWYIGRMNLYYCKIWENNILIRNMVPCYRNSDSVVGLYDTVNNVFYEGIGEATVTYGAVVTLPNPDYPQDIHVVSGNNTIIISNSDNTQSQSYPINLGNIELCKIGDYQDSIVKDNDKWYLNKQINKVVLNGSENWSYTNNTFLISEIENYKNKDENICLSNFYTTQNNVTATSQVLDNHLTFRYDTSEFATKRLYIKNSNITSANAFKTWLSNNNVTLYYVLATPTYIEITDSALINQLEALKKAISYNEQTNISQENNDLPFILNVSALEKNSSN